MGGKRVIVVKRPAVLCAAAFVIGISVSDTSWPVVFLWGLGGWFLWFVWLTRLRKGNRTVSAADRFLCMVPVFLFLGCFVMKKAEAEYEGCRRTFAACMEEGKEVLAKGSIARMKRSDGGIQIELADAAVASYNGEEEQFRTVGNLLVYAEDVEAVNGELKHGQKIFVYGKASAFSEATNPGMFDAKGYYFSLGITGAIQGKTIRITDVSYHRLDQAFFQMKNKLTDSYVTYLGQEGAGVIASMLLGERALLSEETQELYRQGGISHVLAISGLHVSLIGTALYALLRKTILGRNGAIPVACLAVILYGNFVEAGTSTKRAVIMFLLLLLATALGRTYDTLSAMSVSVIVILFQSPGALYTASFQLSFAAAYGASVLAVLLKESGESAGGVADGGSTGTVGGSSGVYHSGKEKVKGMFLFGLAIQAVSFPFTVYHFFEYPLYGFFLNPIVVPLMTVLLLCGMLSGVCGLFVPWLGHFFAGGTAAVLWIYETLCKLVERLPGSLLLVGQPKVWQMGLYYIVLAALLCLWRSKGGASVAYRSVGTSAKSMKSFALRCVGGVWKFFGKPVCFFCSLILLPLCLFPIPLWATGTGFEAVFLDVGQGDGMVFREAGAVFLIDGGSSGMQKAGEKRMIPYLKSQGIRVIDCAFVSHTDSDHMNGIKEILEAMPENSGYRQSWLGYTGTPVIRRLVLPAWEDGAAETEDLRADSSERTGMTNGAGMVSGMLREEDEAFRELVALARRKQVEVYFMKAGDCMTVGDKLTFTCLAPEEGVIYENKNAASMVLLASYEEFDLLLTGDMEKEGEERMLEQMNGQIKGKMEQEGGTLFGALLDSVEVLKVSHHGSRTASSPKFVSAISPQISVISCGKNNRYGHPHPETLEALYGADSEVFRTDERGCIRVRVRKDGEVVVKSWRRPD